MIYPSIDKILNAVDSKYALVYIVANRSKEMIKTKHYQMKETEYKSSKPTCKIIGTITNFMYYSY